MSKHLVMVGSKNSLLTQKNLEILWPVGWLGETEKKKESLEHTLWERRCNLMTCDSGSSRSV